MTFESHKKLFRVSKHFSIFSVPAGEGGQASYIVFFNFFSSLDIFPWFAHASCKTSAIFPNAIENLDSA